MSGNPYIYILTMAAVSYLIRVLPLTLIRREIRSRFLRSFLYYVPYVTLAVMTFPSDPHRHVPPRLGVDRLRRRPRHGMARQGPAARRLRRLRHGVPVRAGAGLRKPRAS